MIIKTFEFLEEHNKISLAITFFIAIFIFYMSSLSFSSDSGAYNINLLCILYHFSVFFALNFFLTMTASKKIKNKPLFLFIILAISLVYAALDEIHQYFVPGRTATINDFYINSAGIILSSLFYISVDKFRKSQK